MINRIFILFFLIISSGLTYADTGRSYWVKTDKESVRITGDRWITSLNCKYYELDVTSFSNFLRTAPASGKSEIAGADLLVELPLPDGRFSTFGIQRNSVFTGELQEKYPNIVTLSGFGIDDPHATIRLDVTTYGFHAMVLTPSGTYFIDPVSSGNKLQYQVYYKHEFVTSKTMNCLVDELKLDEQKSSTQKVARTNGADLKTYRLAMACTGEYTQFHGGTIPSALSAITTSINRVAGIYEREFAVTFSLVPNTDTLIFLNPSTDPYTNNSGFAMLGQNQSTCDQRIGSSNYDMGHVFSTGGGGIANLAGICKVSSKARGVTGLASPVGDAFDVDYVSHEMGHQFGGNHTFNSQSGACNGNRAFTAAYEPGSGATIMAYAGICGFNNLQSNSDDYFHTKSFDEIVNYITTNAGGVCPQVTPTNNTPPTINAGGNYIIPYLTPFRLTGSATDPDGDPLTYCWEQHDLGPAGNWNAPSLNAPIFRSFDPTPTPIRLFPKLSNILSNTTTIGELMASYDRTLHFRLTVRDNRPGGGGVTNNDTLVEVQVIDTGTPFAITAPNTTGIKWNGGTTETVTWDVGGSDLAPISTPNVNILLSLDGGQTFPITLASSVPNNGSANVNIPFVLTTSARVMVEGDGNIFFDINDKDFDIGTVGLEEFSGVSFNVSPNPASSSFELTVSEKNVNDRELIVTDMRGRTIYKTMIRDHVSLINTSTWEKGVYTLSLFSVTQRPISKYIVIQ